MPPTIICIIFNILVTIIIFIKRKSLIIKDTGIYSCIIFSIGSNMIFIGIICFLKFSQMGCFLNSFFIHIGFLLIYTQYLYKTILSTQYGILQKNPDHQNKLYVIFNREKPLLDKILNSAECNSNFYMNNNNDNGLNSNIPKTSRINSNTNAVSTLNNYEIKDQNLIQKDDTANILNRYISNNDKLIIEEDLDMPKITDSFSDLKKYVKRTKVNYFESYFLGVVQVLRVNCVLVIFYILVFSFYYINFFYLRKIKIEKTLVKNSFITTCYNGKTELLLATTEDILILILLFRGRKIFKYSLVLNEIRNLTISEYIWIFIGPLVDVIILLYIYK